MASVGSNDRAGIGTGGADPGQSSSGGTGDRTYTSIPNLGLTGNGNTDAPGTPATYDWESYLQNWGFPPDVIAQLTQIFQTYSDPTQAQAAALAYIRGTSWYAQTFPGIQQGINNGLISDESSYRAYTNDVNQYYQRYYGRNATSNEISSALTAGTSATDIGEHLQGQANIAASGPQIQYELGAFDTKGQATTDQLNSYGDQTAGLSNLVGTQLDQRIQLAQQKMQKIFSGTLATPALSMLKGGAPQGTSLNPQANAPDVSA